MTSEDERFDALIIRLLSNSRWEARPTLQIPTMNLGIVISGTYCRACSEALRDCLRFMPDVSTASTIFLSRIYISIRQGGNRSALCISS